MHICKICGTKHASLTPFAKHLFLHLNLMPFVCFSCTDNLTSNFKKSYMTNNVFFVSEKNSELSEESNCLCGVCHRSFPYFKDFVLHMPAHKQEFSQCSTCRLSFPTDFGHSEPKVLPKCICIICKTTFEGDPKCCIFEPFIFCHIEISSDKPDFTFTNKILSQFYLFFTIQEKSRNNSIITNSLVSTLHRIKSCKKVKSSNFSSVPELDNTNLDSDPIIKACFEVNRISNKTIYTNRNYHQSKCILSRGEISNTSNVKPYSRTHRKKKQSPPPKNTLIKKISLKTSSLNNGLHLTTYHPSTSSLGSVFQSRGTQNKFVAEVCFPPNYYIIKSTGNNLVLKLQNKTESKSMKQNKTDSLGQAIDEKNKTSPELPHPTYQSIDYGKISHSDCHALDLSSTARNKLLLINQNNKDSIGCTTNQKNETVQNISSSINKFNVHGNNLTVSNSHETTSLTSTISSLTFSSTPSALPVFHSATQRKETNQGKPHAYYLLNSQKNTSISTDQTATSSISSKPSSSHQSTLLSTTSASNMPEVISLTPSTMPSTILSTPSALPVFHSATQRNETCHGKPRAYYLLNSQKNTSVSTDQKAASSISLKPLPAHQSTLLSSTSVSNMPKVISLTSTMPSTLLSTPSALPVVHSATQRNETCQGKPRAYYLLNSQKNTSISTDQKAASEISTMPSYHQSTLLSSFRFPVVPSRIASQSSSCMVTETDGLALIPKDCHLKTKEDNDSKIAVLKPKTVPKIISGSISNHVNNPSDNPRNNQDLVVNGLPSLNNDTSVSFQKNKNSVSLDKSEIIIIDDSESDFDDSEKLNNENFVCGADLNLKYSVCSDNFHSNTASTNLSISNSTDNIQCNSSAEEKPKRKNNCSSASQNFFGLEQSKIASIPISLSGLNCSKTLINEKTQNVESNLLINQCNVDRNIIQETNSDDQKSIKFTQIQDCNKSSLINCKEVQIADPLHENVQNSKAVTVDFSHLNSKKKYLKLVEKTDVSVSNSIKISLKNQSEDEIWKKFEHKYSLKRLSVCLEKLPSAICQYSSSLKHEEVKQVLEKSKKLFPSVALSKLPQYVRSYRTYKIFARSQKRKLILQEKARLKSVNKSISSQGSDVSSVPLENCNIVLNNCNNHNVSTSDKVETTLKKNDFQWVSSDGRCSTDVTTKSTDLHSLENAFIDKNVVPLEDLNQSNNSAMLLLSNHVKNEPVEQTEPQTDQMTSTNMKISSINSNFQLVSLSNHSPIDLTSKSYATNFNTEVDSTVEVNNFNSSVKKKLDFSSKQLIEQKEIPVIACDNSVLYGTSLSNPTQLFVPSTTDSNELNSPLILNNSLSFVPFTANFNELDSCQSSVPSTSNFQELNSYRPLNTHPLSVPSTSNTQELNSFHQQLTHNSYSHNLCDSELVNDDKVPMFVSELSSDASSLETGQVNDENDCNLAISPLPSTTDSSFSMSNYQSKLSNDCHEKSLENIDAFYLWETDHQLKYLKNRIEYINKTLAEVVEKRKTMKSLVPKVLLHRLPDSIYKKHLCKKPIMLSNILPVIMNVHSLADGNDYIF